MRRTFLSHQSPPSKVLRQAPHDKGGRAAVSDKGYAWAEPTTCGTIVGRTDDDDGVCIRARGRTEDEEEDEE